MELKEIEEKVAKITELKPDARYVILVKRGAMSINAISHFSGWLVQDRIHAVILQVQEDGDIRVLEIEPSDTTNTNSN